MYLLLQVILSQIGIKITLQIHIQTFKEQTVWGSRLKSCMAMKSFLISTGFAIIDFVNDWNEPQQGIHPQTIFTSSFHKKILGMVSIIIWEKKSVKNVVWCLLFYGLMYKSLLPQYNQSTKDGRSILWFLHNFEKSM